MLAWMVQLANMAVPAVAGKHGSIVYNVMPSDGKQLQAASILCHGVARC